MRVVRRLPLRTLLWSAVVALGAAVGGLLALWSFSAGYRLSVGTITVSVSPFHQGALDVYVPLVDWGVRFPGVALPARLNVGVQAVDREAAASIAQGGLATVDALRDEARDAIADYLRLLALIAGAASAALGLLVAAAVRPFRRGHRKHGLPEAPATAPSAAEPSIPQASNPEPAKRGAVRERLARQRWWAIPVVTVALGWVAAVALLLAPRGDLPDPVYYAHGADIPVALEAITAAGRSSDQVSASFSEQIKGLARLVIDPGDRPDLSDRPRLTIASDMHNNVLLTPTLRRAAAGGPVLFAGDLTDTGSPLEVSAVRSVVTTGDPFVMIAGNHDSDRSLRTLAREGAIVLTSRGRLLPGGRYGATTVRVNGLRVAGYGSPNLRRSSRGYRDRGTAITDDDQAAFAAWFATIVDDVDVVMVHEPSLAQPVIDRLRAERRERADDRKRSDDEPPSILFVLGDTHVPAVDAADGVVAVNGGTIGAGGTGNLAEGQNASLAIVTYGERPFAPLAADLVTLDPGTGETVARRVRIDDRAPVRVADGNGEAPD
jgi:predicted phosphodiesterase